MIWQKKRRRAAVWEQSENAGHDDRSGREYGSLRRLLSLGIVLQFLMLGMYATVARLNWYPARLGPISEWLDQHAYALARSAFRAPEGLSGIAPVAVYFVSLVAMFGVYALAIRHAWRIGPGTRRAFGLIFGFSVLLSFSALLQPYLSSQDIFSYAFYSHISALYGGNPYVAIPRDFPFDPLFGAIFWKDQPSNYGPLWTYMTALVTLLVGTNTALTLVGLKVIATAFALGCIPLIWLVLSRTAPAVRLAGTLLFSWNPLVILETAGSGHNDAVVGFFVLLGLYLYLRGAKLGGGAVLVLSVLTKYVTVVLLPLYLLLWLRETTGVRERLVVLAKFAAITAVMLAVAFIPANGGAAAVQVAGFGTNPSAYINSPLELAFREMRVLLGDPRDVASLPLRHRPWWVTTNTPTPLRSAPEATDSSTIGLPAATQLMVVEPKRGPWLHVYAPRLDRYGYVVEAATTPTPAPGFVGPGGTASALAQVSGIGANSSRANLVLRALTGVLFLVLFVYLARKTHSFGQMVYASLVLLFASYWLLQTWFWPWYLIWALPLAALVPQKRLSALMLAFSLTTLGLHARIDIAPLPYMDVFYEYRSLAIFGLPVILVGAYLALPHIRLQAPALASLSVPGRWKTHIGAALVLAVLAATGSLGVFAAAEGRQQSATAWESEKEDWSAESIEAYWAGVAYLEKNYYPEAIDQFTRAIAARPDYTDAYRLRYVAWLVMGKFEDAASDISAILASEGDELDLLVARGNVYLQTQRYQLALQDFSRAIALDPTDPRAYRYRAQAYYEIGLLAEAVLSQQQAIALAPNSAILYRELAAMHATLGHMQGALVLFDVSISLDRYDVESYVGRASVLRILGRGEEGIPDLREVLVLSNDEDLRTWARRAIAAVLVPDVDDKGSNP